jgi:hypothetical protein
LYRGGKHLLARDGEASKYVAEYSTRKKLAVLGFTSPLKDLPAWKAEIFVLIDNELNKMHDEDIKQARTK